MNVSVDDPWTLDRVGFLKKYLRETCDCLKRMGDDPV